MSTPTKGRIVHYRGQGNEEPMAAIVTWVHEDGQLVNLAVFTETGILQAQQNVPLIVGDPVDWPDRGWSWPPRIPLVESAPADLVDVPTAESAPKKTTTRKRTTRAKQ